MDASPFVYAGAYVYATYCNFRNLYHNNVALCESRIFETDLITRPGKADHRIVRFFCRIVQGSKILIVYVIVES